jgi:Carboxypeptidase regulatory-like domain
MKAFSTARMLAWVTLFLVAGSSSLLFGQNSNTGEVRGLVTDASGATIPDVQVTLTDLLTGVSTRVATNSSGAYDAPTLMPGTYSISFAKTGFATLVRNGVSLGVQVIKEDASLAVGAVTQEITVTGATPLVQTETSESSSTLSTGAVYNLPNVSMQWYNLANLLPGTAQVALIITVEIR